MTHQTIRILGLDPSLTAFGWCICTLHHYDGEAVFSVRDGGCATTKPMSREKKKHSYVGEDDIERATFIASAIASAADGTDIDCIAYEISGGAQSSRASRALGIAAGITASAAGMLYPGALLIGVTAIDAKLLSVLNAGASKERVIEWAESISPMGIFEGESKGRKSGIADAVAVAFVASLTRQCLSRVGAHRVRTPMRIALWEAS